MAEPLKQHQTLWQMWKSTLVICQILQVRITSDTQMIQSSDWPKLRCTLWRNVNSRFSLHIASFRIVRQTESRYINCQSMEDIAKSMSTGNICFRFLLFVCVTQTGRKGVPLNISHCICQPVMLLIFNKYNIIPYYYIT